MTLRRCIPEMLERGEITREQAEKMGRLYDELEADLSTKFGREAAATMASEEVISRLEAEALQAKRQALLQVAVQQRITADMGKYTGRGRGNAALALIDHDGRAPYSNVEARRRAIEGQAHAMVSGVLRAFRRNVTGRVRNRALLHDVVREAFGQDSGSLAAKELAEAWGRTAEMLRTRFNAAGGGIGKLEHWGLPQTHDMRAVRVAGYEKWRNFISPLLDRERMLDATTGMRMTPQGLEMALRASWEKIRSDGWSERKPSGQGGGKKLANRHAESRFFVFKDPESWMAYNREYGRPRSGMANAIDPDGPVFDAMMGHISSMSRDIALAEVLGPNPAATIRWIGDTLKHDEAVSSDPTTKGVDRSVRAVRQLERLFDEVSGRNSQPENAKLAMRFSALRSFQTAAKLGSATLSATTDIAFQHVTRRFNGVPAASALGGYVKLLNPLSSRDREHAVRLRLVAEEASKMAASQSRYLNEVLTGETAARLAESVLRASGLSAWTQAGRWAFGMEVWSHISHERNKAWGSLDARFRRMLNRYGLGEGEWDALRRTPTEDYKGSAWILPENIGDSRLADRVTEAILTETDYAVPVASLRTRAMFNRLPKGTWIGEIARSALLFKSFGISMILTHGRRMMEEEGFNKLRYASGLVISTTLLGALAYQMKAIARGQDPAPMEDPTFWGQAMAQGGGFGIYGDFINSATSRFDDDIYSTLAGPMVSELVQMKRLASGPRRGRQLTKMIKSDLPGSSVWYTKLAFQRTMLDQLQREIDPDYYDSFQKMEEYARKNGTDFWWRPGEPAPSRSPDYGNVLDAAPPH